MLAHGGRGFTQLLKRNPQNHAIDGRARPFVGFQIFVCTCHDQSKRAGELSNTQQGSIHCDCGVRNPDLRLPGTLGDGFELDQKHVIQVHEPLAHLPRGGTV